jgi:hypothetical protein
MARVCGQGGEAGGTRSWRKEQAVVKTRVQEEPVVAGDCAIRHCARIVGLRAAAHVRYPERPTCSAWRLSAAAATRRRRPSARKMTTVGTRRGCLGTNAQRQSDQLISIGSATAAFCYAASCHAHTRSHPPRLRARTFSTPTSDHSLSLIVARFRRSSAVVTSRAFAALCRPPLGEW